MGENDLFNSVSDQLSSEEEEIINLHYALWIEREAREQEKEKHKIDLKDQQNSFEKNLYSYIFKIVIKDLKKSLGYSKLESSVQKTKESFDGLGIKTNKSLFLVCALYDIVDSLLSKEY